MANSKTKFGAVIAVATVTTLLSGCSLLYPNWGATSFPSHSASASQTPSETPSETPTPTETPKPTPTVTPKNKAKIQLNDVQVDTDNGVIDVIAEVTNVFEEGGTCKLTVTSGETSATAKARAEQNVTDTQCGLLEVNLSELAKGKGKLVVTYSSDKSEGTSETQVVTIP